MRAITDIKEMQHIALDVLIYLDKVCSKYGLKYFIVDGTLLGAVRHKGFIPWDDDIDVWMPRADYDRLQMLYDRMEKKNINFVHHRIRKSLFIRLVS